MVEIVTPSRNVISKAVNGNVELTRALEALFNTVRETEVVDTTVIESQIAGLQRLPAGATNSSLGQLRADFEASQLTSITFIADVLDFPAAVGGIITLADYVTYWIIGTVDLAGSRIVAGQNTVIIGGSSENAKLISTGLTGAALLSSEYTLPMRHITLEAETVLDLDATANAGQALDWYGVNISNTQDVGTIQGYTNFVAQSMALLSASGLVFDGEVGTISLGDTIFVGNATGDIITIPATAEITRRFRVVYSAFINSGSGAAINFDASAVVPLEGFILDTCNFSGGGTYVDGVQNTDAKSLWVNNVGVENSSNVANYYMQGNATATVIASSNTPVKVAGVTTSLAVTQGFTHTDNRVTYTRGIPRTFKCVAISTFTGSSNKQFGFSVALNGVVLAETRQTGTTGTGGRAENVPIQGTVVLEQGDYVEIWVENLSGSSNVTVEDINVIVESIA